jgi:acid phosphatase (class A)
MGLFHLLQQKSNGRTSLMRGAQLHLIALALASLLIALGCANVTTPLSPVAAPSASLKMVVGYLSQNDLPDSLALLPPPPSPDSAAFAADQDAYRMTRVLRDTPRWAAAAEDADLTFPAVTATFSCALDAPITEEATPHLYNLMRRTRADASLGTTKAKDHYQRTRPFVVNKEATCAPRDEPALMKNGSYPSGHTTTGWTWALILTEVAPDRTDAILARGYAYGWSRVVCGAHWQSDVNAGFILAAAVVARLHADPAFRTQLEAAKAEVANARAKALKPTRDCKAEAAALAF